MPSIPADYPRAASRHSYCCVHCPEFPDRLVPPAVHPSLCIVRRAVRPYRFIVFRSVPVHKSPPSTQWPRSGHG
eukprot:6085547-Pyramimonas_sp.AAC.1